MPSKRQRSTVALFGNTVLIRGTCPSCNETVILTKNKHSSCCNMPIKLLGRISTKRESEPVQARKMPSKDARKAILDLQNHRCLYCELDFGRLVCKPKRKNPSVLRIEWDHWIPYSYSQNNQDANFVATCQICNGLKACKIYATLDEARLDLLAMRQKIGYTLVE